MRYSNAGGGMLPSVPGEPARLFRRFVGRLLPGPVLISLLAMGLSPANAYAAVTYYVDCAGNDGNSGTSPTSAWRSVGRANQASLSPGS